MDTDTTIKSTLLIRFEVRTTTDEARNRLLANHGFSTDENPPAALHAGVEQLYKRSMTTYDDAITYARTLKGIPGIIDVQILIDTEKKEEPEPADIG